MERHERWHCEHCGAGREHRTLDDVDDGTGYAAVRCTACGVLQSKVTTLVVSDDALHVTAPGTN